MAAMRRDSGSILGDEGSVNAANGEQMLKAQDDLDALSRGGDQSFSNTQEPIAAANDVSRVAVTVARDENLCLMASH